MHLRCVYVCMCVCVCTCAKGNCVKFQTEIFTNTVGFHARQPVKFSSQPNLKEEECRKLLLQYMPDHVKSTKITQRLFIK